MTRTSWAALAFSAALFLPFLGKPFHIDDANFLVTAKAMERSAAAASGVELYHLGQRATEVDPLASTHPPLVPLLVRGLAILSGGYSEVAMHLGFLVFPMLLLWSVGQLAERLGSAPGPAMLAVGGGIAVLPVGHTLMADLPTSALFAGGAVLLDRALGRRSILLGLGAALLLLLALTASYQVVLLLPAMLALVPGHRSPRSFRLIAIGIACLAFVSLLVLHFVERLPILVPILTQGLRLDWLANRLLGVPVLLGTALVCLLPITRLSRIPRWPMAAALGAGVALAVGLALSGYPPLGTVVLVLLGWAGIAAALVAISRSAAAWRARPIERFLAAWAVAALLVALFLLPFGAMRYLIPAVIPLSLLLLAAAKSRARAWVVAGLTAAVGLAVAVADYQLAAVYRDFAREVRAEIGPAPPEGVWYAGDWGMKHYMGEHGFRYLTAGSNEPRTGDLVIFATVARMWSPSPALGPRMELLEVREIRARWPVVVMSQETRAGLYSTLWGLYPFTVGRGPVERFAVYRVVG